MRPLLLATKPATPVLWVGTALVLLGLAPAVGRADVILGNLGSGNGGSATLDSNDFYCRFLYHGKPGLLPFGRPDYTYHQPCKRHDIPAGKRCGRPTVGQRPFHVHQSDLLFGPKNIHVHRRLSLHSRLPTPRTGSSVRRQSRVLVG